MLRSISVELVTQLYCFVQGHRFLFIYSLFRSVSLCFSSEFLVAIFTSFEKTEVWYSKVQFIFFWRGVAFSGKRQIFLESVINVNSFHNPCKIAMFFFFGEIHFFLQLFQIKLHYILSLNVPCLIFSSQSERFSGKRMGVFFLFVSAAKVQIISVGFRTFHLW